jgi:hypothetical protein
MTRKRFKLSLAALCLLTAFFMALIGLLLAPTLASAEKNSGAEHQHADEPNGNGAPNPVYSEHANWHEQDKNKDKITWNAPHTGPCEDQTCGNQGEDTQYSEGGSSGDADHSSNGHNGNSEHNGNEGNGSPGFLHGGGTGPGGFGGFPGGPSGDLPEHFVPDSSNHGDSCSDETNSHDSNAGDACSDGSDPDDAGQGGPQVHLTPPNDPYDDPSHNPDGRDDPSPEDKNPSDGPTTNLVTQVPEPLTLSLFAVGLAGSVAMRRRRKVK